MTRLLRISILILLCIPAVSRAASWYASPTGTDGGAGTSADPISIAKAIGATSPASAGDTIWLFGGTYTGHFTSVLAGSSGSPITLRSLPNARAALQGTNAASIVLDMQGQYTTVRDLEIYNANTNRATYRADGVNVLGEGTGLLNCVIHDTGNGIGTWSSATNAWIYGCVIYNGGYQEAEPDSGHGHGIYAQNELGTKLISDTIIFGQFGYGLHVYTQEGFIQGFNITNNVIFNNGTHIREPQGNEVLIGGYTPADRIDFVGNTIYGIPHDTANSYAWFGYVLGASPNGSFNISQNYFAQQITQFYSVTNLTLLSNVMVPIDWGLVSYTLTGTPYVWDSNTYWDVTGAGLRESLDGGVFAQLSFAQMQAKGYDVNGSSTASLPTSNAVFVRPNTYESGRANIVVYNWEGLDNVSVDISSATTSGRTIRVRNGADYYASPVLTATYGGGSITLPMTNLTAATPISMATPTPVSPTFAVFVLESVQSSARIANARIVNATLR